MCVCAWGLDLHDVSQVPVREEMTHPLWRVCVFGPHSSEDAGMTEPVKSCSTCSELGPVCRQQEEQTPRTAPTTIDQILSNLDQYFISIEVEVVEFLNS